MRYLSDCIKSDLRKKVVFIGGPRQCGKTTLAKSLLEEAKHSIYLNWDNSQHRKDILGQRWTKENTLIAFDELHKFKNWKSWLKDC